MKTIEQTYYFNISEFNEYSNNRNSDKIFTDYFYDWEVDFYKQHKPYYANFVFANSLTMMLFRRCYENPVEDYGMDLIDGEIDLDTNLAIDNHSKRRTVYAYGSKLKGRTDEPVYLIIDDSIKEGSIIFKFVFEDDAADDEDDDYEVEPDIPPGISKEIEKRIQLN